MIIRGPENALSQRLTEAEKNLGIDLKLTKDNDLQLNNRGDIDLVTGAANAAQALLIRLFVEPGGILHHPSIGTDLQIGEKTANAFELQNQVIKSLSQDPRLEDVKSQVTVEGNTVFINVSVRLVNTGIEVPFQFAVIR